MKNCIKGLLMLLMISLFFSCTEGNSSTELTLPPTTLKIIVKDDSGNPVSQAQVKIFGSELDYNNFNQSFTTQLTNNQGEATFSSSVNRYNTYYWLVTKDCKTNIFDTNNHNNLFLSSNFVNTYSTTISDKGILKFTNNSSNPYNVFVNNVMKISNLAINTSSSYFYPPGNYSIRVEQQSGFLFKPTIISYTGTLNCGSILITTFPN